jgi:hypothetical protein
MAEEATLLHGRAQQAEMAGNHELAATLYLRAADCALTPNGRVVLEEKARLAMARTRTAEA